ncbi:MAG: hypothetical protein A4E66_02291 [Syntrophus sp. PtaB.Bin001]|nr:MAG: hypothetical protein A4E66_02291 [Syntrophus sp. PtaB.Bin001]
MSEYLSVLEHEIHIAALFFMCSAYVVRILWLFKFKFGLERSIPAKYHSRAVAASLLTVAKPWTIEKNRKTPMFYIQFAIFHLGAAAAIGMTFILPYWPEILKIHFVERVLQIILAAAFIIGLARLYRRIFDPVLRLISTPDDYFALVMMIAFYAVGLSVVSNRYGASDGILVTFFLMTAFFHLYVPFSKIIHYLYYPFTRYYLGETMVHRGIGNNAQRDKSIAE